MSHTAPRDIKTPLLSMFQRNFCNQLMAAKMRAQQQPNVDPNESNLCIYMRFSFLMYEQMVACSIYEYERRTDQGKETATETEKGPLFDDIHFPSPSTAATTITTEPDRNDDEDETIALSNGKVQVNPLNIYVLIYMIPEPLIYNVSPSPLISLLTYSTLTQR